MRCRRGVALVGALLVVSGAGVQRQAWAQASAGEEGPTLRANSTLVLVPALVRTKVGELVYSLKADDFTLTDDGVPQKLTLEEDTGGEPLALVVAIEIGGAGAREFNKYRALPRMIESVVGDVPHRVAVVGFDSQPGLVQDFTEKIDEAAAAIEDVTTGCGRRKDDCDATNADNGAAILDTIGFSVEMLRKQPQTYRRAILLVSETLDRGSRMKLDEALRAIGDTNTAIYSIGFSTGRSEAAHYGHRELPTEGSGLERENTHPDPPHGCMGKDPDPDIDATKHKAVQAYDCLTQLAPPLALAKMAAIAATDGLRKNIPETVARLTGGEYFKLTDAKSLERDLATISNHIPNRYILSFQPLTPHGGLHGIELKLKGYPGLEVMARDGYWADGGGVEGGK